MKSKNDMNDRSTTPKLQRKAFLSDKPFMKLIGILSPIFVPIQFLWKLADPPVLNNIEDLQALLKTRRLIVGVDCLMKEDYRWRSIVATSPSHCGSSGF